MANTNDEIARLVAQLREAAAQLESQAQQDPHDALKTVENGHVLSCCGTCTAVSSIPPCANACIQVSPLF